MVKVLSRRSVTLRRGASRVFSVPHLGHWQVRMVCDGSPAEWFWVPIVQIHEIVRQPPIRESNFGRLIGNELK